MSGSMGDVIAELGPVVKPDLKPLALSADGSSSNTGKLKNIFIIKKLLFIQCHYTTTNLCRFFNNF